MYDKVVEKKHKKRIHFTKFKVNRSAGGSVAMGIVVLIFALFSAFPLYYTIIQSLKPMTELWIFPPKFYVINPTYKNFVDLFVIVSNSTVPFLRYVFNTLMITVVNTVGQILISSMAAYPLAKHDFPGKNGYFRIIVLSLMFSGAVTTIPNYLILAKLGWIDTYLSIIVPALGGTLGLYLMKQFMEQIPDSILEAAKMDGSNEWLTFWKIVMPSVKPAWLTLIVFSVQAFWSMGASTFIYSEQYKTMPYALGQILAAGIARAGVGCAVAVVIMSVPIIVFVFTQGNVIQTMTSSGIKE